MCGIAGIINFNGQPVEKADLKLMTDAIKHRGPDGEGFYVHENVGFGHRRLAIIDLSDAGAQPMTRFGCTITYNGEIYNYIEIRQELEKKGVAFTTKTDTEVILAAYHVWGIECVQRFNGMWSFAIHDQVKQQVFFSRDRFGEKPFYYTKEQNRFLFASEIKGLLPLFIQRKPQWNALAQFVIFGQADQNDNTFFELVKKLPAGHNLSLDLNSGAMNLQKYYSLEPVNLTNADDEQQCIQQVIGLLQSSIDLRLRSDVTVGTALSGGLDSSLVSVMAARLYHTKTTSKFCAVTAGNIDKQFDESNYARSIANHADLKWLRTIPDMAFFEKHQKQVVQAQEEPFDSASVFMQYAVMKAAKEAGLVVLLDGQGADEVFLGYPHHLSLFWKTAGFPANWRALPSILNHYHISLPNWLQLQYYHSNYGLKAKWQQWRMGHGGNWRQHVDASFARSLQQAMAGSLKGFQKHELLISRLPLLLRYEDKNSMSYSIETRLPFLDHRLVELALSLPMSMKIKGGWSKYLLRKSAADFLPNDIRWRKGKLGFVAPEAIWLDNGTLWKKQITNSRVLAQLVGKVTLDTLSHSRKWRLWSVAAWEEQFEIQG